MSESESVDVKSLDYVAAMSELEGIVRELDQGVVNVDVLSAQFTRAIDIIEELNARILKTKRDVDVLATRLEMIAAPTDVSTGSDPG